MEVDEPTSEQGYALASAMLHAIGDERYDEAEALLERLRERNRLSEDHPDILLFRVMIGIQRGHAVDALCYLNNLDENHCPELRALCLFFAEDPLWQGLAADLAASSPHSEVRHSMSLLLKAVPS